MSDVLDDIFGENPKLDKVEVKKDKKKMEGHSVPDYLPGVGVDIGTANIVVARKTKDGSFVNRYHRDMLYPLDVSEESTDLLERSDYLYVKVGDKYYIVGEDALRLVNAIGKGEVVRPMKDGLLNPDLKESSELLFYIIKAVVGAPIVENEPLRFSVPANPVDADIDNTFHQMVLSNFFKKLGYSPKPVNEAMCIVYDCNPVSKTDEGDVQLSGIACSAGAGMTNIALSYKGMELKTFSVTKSGDYVDVSASKATGTAISKVMKRKEKELNLSSMDPSDRILSALYIYYQEVIDRCLHHISKEFKESSSEMEGSIEIVVAGGTSMPKGYIQMFEESLRDKNLPFDVYRVRHSDTPFNSVSQGACIRAQADYQKNQK
jgi:hypothetical protein